VGGGTIEIAALRQSFARRHDKHGRLILLLFQAWSMDRPAGATPSACVPARYIAGYLSGGV